MGSPKIEIINWTRGTPWDLLVANARFMDGTLPEQIVYVGRSYRDGPGPSVLANPWSHIPGANVQEFYHVDSRDEAIERYEIWLRNHWRKRPNQVSYELFRLAKLATNAPLLLVCHCAPLRCHAECIREAITWMVEEGLTKET